MENNIFGFDVSMYDFQGVDLVYSLTDLTHDEGDSRLREGL